MAKHQPERARMSIWNLTRSFFFGIVFVVALFLPHEAECAKKDKHRDKSKENTAKTVDIKGKKTPTPQPKQWYPPGHEPVSEEKLTPAELKKKIATFRRHISAKNTSDEKMLLEAFDDLSHTQIGRHLLERMHPDLRIVGKDGTGASALYSFLKQTIFVDSRCFQEINKTDDEELKTIYKVYLAETIGHEMAHAEQDRFPYRSPKGSPKPSVSEVFTTQKMTELHALLIEAVVGNQVFDLPKYRGKIDYDQVPEMDIFFYKLKKAKMKEGADEKTADRFARSTFVETFWSNNPSKPIYVGKYKIMPPAERMMPWSHTYNDLFFGTVRKYADVAAKEDSGDDGEVNYFTKLMQIDTPASFFRDPETRGFKFVSKTRFQQYTDGIVSLELDLLEVGRVVKKYENGGIRGIFFKAYRKPELSKLDHVERFDSGKVRAKYTCAMGGVHGTYTEFDEHGNKIMEIPVTKNVVEGEGWVLEDGKRVKKQFYGGYTAARKAPRKRKK